jgi:hypothetical protein
MRYEALVEQLSPTMVVSTFMILSGISLNYDHV